MERIKEEVTCPICRGLLHSPVTFQCYHSMCKECCSNLFDSCNSGNHFACPVCKKWYPIPDKGVEAYDLNRSLNNIADILQETGKYGCLIHVNETVILYCVENESVLCRKCLFEERHMDHSHMQLSSDQLKEHLQNSLVSMRKETLDCVFKAHKKRQGDLRAVIATNNESEKWCIEEIESFFAAESSANSDHKLKKGLLAALQKDVSEANRVLQKELEVDDLAKLRVTLQEIQVFASSLKSDKVFQIAMQSKNINKYLKKLSQIDKDFKKKPDIASTKWKIVKASDKKPNVSSNKWKIVNASEDDTAKLSIWRKTESKNSKHLSDDKPIDIEPKPMNQSVINTEPKLQKEQCDEPIDTKKPTSESSEGALVEEHKPKLRYGTQVAIDPSTLESAQFDDCGGSNKPPSNPTKYQDEQSLDAQSVAKLRQDMKELNNITYERLHADMMEIKSMMKDFVKPAILTPGSTLSLEHKRRFSDNAIAGENTYFIQGSHPQSLNWEKYGIRMHFPANTLVSPDDHCEVSILALIGRTSFIYPENTELVSCIYSIKLSKEINKCPRVEIEHCVSLKKESDLDHLIFAASEKDNCERLVAVKGAKFYVSNRYGVVEQMHFCWKILGIFKWIGSILSPTPANLYSGYLLSEPTAPDKWLVEFIVVKDIEAHEESLIERQKKRQCSFKFEFSHTSSNESAIVLDLSEPIPEGWKLMPECEPLYLLQSHIDIFELRNEVQSRHIDVHAEKTAKLLNYCIELKGIKMRCLDLVERYFIRLSPPEPIPSPTMRPNLAIDSKALCTRIQGLVENALTARLVDLSKFLTEVLDTFRKEMIQAGLVTSNIRDITYDGIMQQFTSGLIFTGDVQGIEVNCHKLFDVFEKMGAKDAAVQIKKDLREQVYEQLHINMFN